MGRIGLKLLPFFRPHYAPIWFNRHGVDVERPVLAAPELERGVGSLDESLRLWERGEKLAKHCEAALAGARRRIEDALAAADEDRGDDEV